MSVRKRPAAQPPFTQSKERVTILSSTVTRRSQFRRTLGVRTIFAKSAETRELAFDYLAAAQDWNAAFEQVEYADTGLAFKYRMAQAVALRAHGEFSGDNVSRSSVELHKDVLDSVPRLLARRLAMAQSNLGNALQTLGLRKNETTLLTSAIEAYRAALEVRTRDRSAIDWREPRTILAPLSTRSAPVPATFSRSEKRRRHTARLWRRGRGNNIRSTGPRHRTISAGLSGAGEGETGTLNLKKAVVAYRAALQVSTREQMPLDWAATQNNLGVALQSLGEREQQNLRLKKP